MAANKITTRVHWFSVTVHVNLQEFLLCFYDRVLRPVFGDLVPSGHGGMGYRELYTALSGLRVYAVPVGVEEHVHLSMPGDACDCLKPDQLVLLYRLIRYSDLRFSVTRLDLAVDYCPFSVRDLYQAMQGDALVSLGKRSTLRYTESLYEEREDHTLGTSSMSFGSRESMRYLRCYDRRGYTRLEVEYKSERAQLIAAELLVTDYPDWLPIVMGHLRQFVDLAGVDWWDSFCEGSERRYITISSARTVTSEKIRNWLYKQVASALYVIREIEGDDFDFLDDLLFQGARRLDAIRKRQGSTRYDVLLAMV